MSAEHTKLGKATLSCLFPRSLGGGQQDRTRHSGQQSESPSANMQEGCRRGRGLDTCLQPEAFPCGSAGEESAYSGGQTWVRSLGWEDPLAKGKATRSSILV